MNLHFLKLRVAADPWVLINRCGPATPDAPADITDWQSAAALVCHPYRGVAARGLVLVDGEAEPYRVQAWNATGQLRTLPPVAALCAARWLFDNGRAAGETVTLEGTGGSESLGVPLEILVLDSRNFGLALGNPQARLADKRTPGHFAVTLTDKTLQVRLHDGAVPSKSSPGMEAKNLVQVGCVARHELHLKARGTDALEAAGAAASAASLAGYADRDCTVLLGDSRIMVQWPEGGPMFLAAAPAYCLAGDIWLDEDTGKPGPIS
ncbi:MAG: hypothetical protein RBT68_07155 [Spirochaetia bacterium]|jgi:diaminopimelate epimerase|nr:hypothetical protein [Spirochaetia bacterium]